MTDPRRQRGIALVAALALLAVGSAVMVLLFMRTMDEIQHGRDDTAIVQTLLVAHGGANLGVALLQKDVKFELKSVVNELADVVGSWTFGNSGVDAIMPTAASVAADMSEVAEALQTRIDALVCGDRDLGGDTVLRVRVHFTDTACGQALPPGTRLGDGHFVSGKRREQGGNQVYALPFVLVSDGQMGVFRRRVVTQGEYQFVVGPASFARYALFTDVHSSAGAGGAIWFTGETLFDGPVHTNGNFNFYGRAWFGGPVSSAGVNNHGQQGAFAYDGDDNGRFMTADTLEPGGNFPNMDVCTNWNRFNQCVDGFENRPQFTGGVDWRSDYLALPRNAFDQRALAQQNGILVTSEVRDVMLYAGDAAGDPVDVGEASTYQFVRIERRSGGNWVTDLYRISPNGRLERRDGGNPPVWTLITDRFNGVLYFDDEIERLRGPGRANNADPMSARPAVASFAQLTIVPEEGARITSDLVYEDQPCVGYLHREGDQVVRPTCENLDALNVLGIFSPDGDVVIGNDNNDSNYNAPRNVRIQASIMTSSGIVAVEHFDRGEPRGAVQLLGGIIEQEYGAFGTFNGNTGNQVSGYSRQFTFDPRLDRGLTPPYFPLIEKDEVSDAYTYTYGHREQVY